MQNPYRAPVHSFENLRAFADGFLRRHHSSGSVPIPIEEIAESLGIYILPLPGLHRVIGVDSFLTGDRREIHVDEFVYLQREKRYRYSVAHELSHHQLHKALYEAGQVRRIADWKAFVGGIPEEEHQWFEWQAYNLAGLLLVQLEPLRRFIDDAFERIKEGGFDLTDDRLDLVWTTVTEEASEHFNVSGSVIRKRLEKEGLYNDYP